MEISFQQAPVIYIISDSLGETAEFVAKAAASQFEGEQLEICKIPFVSNRFHLEEIVEEAGQRPSLIAFTLVRPELRDYLLQLTFQKNINAVDVLGPMIDAISAVTEKKPKLEPGLLRKMDDHYFSKVEAIEFAVQYDDGKDPHGMLRADIVLLGVSRTSKTPVSMYLAHKGLKVSNVPLVPEVAPPEELFQLSRQKIVGFTISPKSLFEIRQARLKTIGLASNADYADYGRILKELEYAEEIMKRLGCSIIDVTNRAVEETASKVLEIYYKGDRYGNR
jgi:regulator of PEP synthase PpsR (kinase-PPPase family)